MTVYNTIREISWDTKRNGESTNLSVEYEWDTEMNTLVVFSVCHAGLEWIDYLSDSTREHITNKISERLEDDR
jgi:hypothetical protein